MTKIKSLSKKLELSYEETKTLYYYLLGKRTTAEDIIAEQKEVVDKIILHLEPVIELVDVINHILFRHFEYDDFHENTKLSDICDSLEKISILMEIEDTYNINISDTDIDDIVYVGDIYKYVYKLLSSFHSSLALE